MVRAAAIALALQASGWDVHLNSPFTEEEARLIWIDLNEGSTGSVFSMRLSDIRNRSNATPEVWIEGNHERDRTVRYRRSMTLLRFFCSEHSYRTLARTTYGADGAMLNSWNGYGNLEYVIPGSLAERWQEAACPK